MQCPQSMRSLVAKTVSPHEHMPEAELDFEGVALEDTSDSFFTALSLRPFRRNEIYVSRVVWAHSGIQACGHRKWLGTFGIDH